MTRKEPYRDVLGGRPIKVPEQTVYIAPLGTPAPTAATFKTHGRFMRWFRRIFLRKGSWQEVGATDQEWKGSAPERVILDEASDWE